MTRPLAGCADHDSHCDHPEVENWGKCPRERTAAHDRVRGGV